MPREFTPGRASRLHPEAIMSEHEAEHDPMGWWCISGSELLDMLRRCAKGEDPDMVYAEAYANSKVERPGEDL